MELKDKKNLQVWYVVAAAICPVLITGICLFIKGRFPGQEDSLFFGDYLAEYLPFFRHFWHAVFHGKSLEYSFSLGLGSPTLAMYSIFAFSPFSIIPYIIKDVTLGGYISWMLKMALSSVSMFFFLKRDLKRNDLTSLVFSLFYSMNSYVMIYYNNIHFMDVFYILPLLIHFLLVFVKEDKSVGLTLCYAFCFINNFFEGFCTGFFSFVIYVLLLWYLDIRGNRLKKNIFLYFRTVMIAVLLSAPVILPAVMFVMQHMSESSDFSVIPLRSPLYIINSLLFGRKINSIFDSMPALYCGWPSVFLTLVFFAGKGDRKKKILAAVPIVLLLICCFWHPAYFFMHLFNEPDSFPWRFSFLLIFVLICVAAYECDQHEKELFSLSRAVPALILLLGVGAGYFLNLSELGDLIPLYTLIFNAAFLIMHFWGYDKKLLFCVLSLSELFLAVDLQLPQKVILGTGQNELRADMAQLEAMRAELAGDKTGFFRSSVLLNDITNESFMFDQPGIDFFCSFDDRNLIQAMRLLGLQARPQQYGSYGSTEFTNMILSVKYSGAVGTKRIDTNFPVLPPVYSVTGDIKDIKLAENPFENQQALADAMVKNDRMIFHPIDIGMGANSSIEMGTGDNNEFLFRKTGENGIAAWYMQDPEEQPAYLYLMTGASGSGNFDSETIISGGTIISQLPISVPMLYSFFSEEGEIAPAVYMSMDGVIGSEVAIKDIKANSLDMSALQEIYDELAPLAMQTEEFKGNMLRGRVTADEEHSVLFTSIPYDIDWQIRIDGREVESYAVFNNAFLACDISPGIHEVEFVYKDSSLLFGLGAFAIGVLLFLMQMRKRQ